MKTIDSKSIDKILKSPQKKNARYDYYYNSSYDPTPFLTKREIGINCSDDWYDHLNTQTLVDMNNMLADELHNKPHTEHEQNALKHELDRLEQIIMERFKNDRNRRNENMESH